MKFCDNVAVIAVFDDDDIDIYYYLYVINELLITYDQLELKSKRNHFIFIS